MWSRKVIILFACLVLLSAGRSFPQAASDAVQLLKRVSETYRNLKSCHFEGVTKVRTQSSSVQHLLETPFVVAAVKPSLLRVETKNSLTAMLIVSDGETTWNYMPRIHEYTRVTGAPAAGLASDGTTASDLSTLPNPIAQYERLTDRSAAARVLREDRIEVGGRSVDCIVVELAPASGNTTGVETLPRMLWIDKFRYLVLRDEETFRIRRPYTPLTEKMQTTVFGVARVNEPVPDSLFKFVPPAEAREVAELSLRSANKVVLGGGSGLRSRVSTSSASLNGASAGAEHGSEANGGTDQTPIVKQPAAANEAVDFTLADLDGSEFQLRRLRGKVVLLDFWASWCGPCRRELPVIEKLHREYRRNGLVVLGINDEQPEVARGFVNGNGYTFATLMDSRHETFRSYRVTAIPTVYFIDKRGRIAARYVGGRSEQDLRAALKQAGLE
ncbi:MAG TPA: redoxin domain-containing protein [Acidobacteriota bacterium]